MHPPQLRSPARGRVLAQVSPSAMWVHRGLEATVRALLSLLPGSMATHACSSSALRSLRLHQEPEPATHYFSSSWCRARRASRRWRTCYPSRCLRSCSTHVRW